MKKWLKKRAADRKAQQAYWEAHKWCEVCLWELRGKVPATEVHEIIFRAQGGKCEPDNEISICRRDHQRTHFLIDPWLYRDDLYRMKEQLDNLSIKDILGG